MPVLQASDKCSHTHMYAALSRSACALPLNLIRGFETTSKWPMEDKLRSSPRTISQRGNKTKNQTRRCTVKGTARRSALCSQGHGYRRFRLHDPHHPFSYRHCFGTCVYIQSKQNSCSHRGVVQQPADNSDILFCKLPGGQFAFRRSGSL